MVIELSAGDLSVGVVDNAAHTERAGHRAGYNGLAWLSHTERRENLFVPTWAGLNLEHYFDGASVKNREVHYEPRFAPMMIRRTGETSVELYQPPPTHLRVESWTTFTLRAPHYVDFQFRAIPRADAFTQGWMAVFWASYIDHPEDLAINFASRETDREGIPVERWIRHDSPKHGEKSTHRHHADTRKISFRYSMDLLTTLSERCYVRPYYYGVSHGMMYLIMFDDTPMVRFAQSPSGGGGGCPAWDFQYIVPDLRVGEEYTLRARLVYKPYPSGTAERDCQAEYNRWRSERVEHGV